MVSNTRPTPTPHHYRKVGRQRSFVKWPGFLLRLGRKNGARYRHVAACFQHPLVQRGRAVVARDRRSDPSGATTHVAPTTESKTPLSQDAEAAAAQIADDRMANR
jgi:hypothetical protein